MLTHTSISQLTRLHQYVRDGECFFPLSTGLFTYGEHLFSYTLLATTRNDLLTTTTFKQTPHRTNTNQERTRLDGTHTGDGNVPVIAAALYSSPRLIPCRPSSLKLLALYLCTAKGMMVVVVS